MREKGREKGRRRRRSRGTEQSRKANKLSDGGKTINNFRLEISNLDAGMLDALIN